jgi:hypothetical protein
VQTGVCKPPEVLQSKIVVLNVQVKMLYKQHQVRVKKLNINEPLMKCGNGTFIYHTGNAKNFLDSF